MADEPNTPEGAEATIREFNDGRRDRLFVTELRAAGFTNEQIAAVIDIATGICPHCWDGRRSTCFCTRDD